MPNGWDLQRFEPDPEARRRLRAEWGIGLRGCRAGHCRAVGSGQKDHANPPAPSTPSTPPCPGDATDPTGTGMDDSRTGDSDEALDGRGWRERTRLLGRRSDGPAS
ncbi:MAG: hypothetical protein R3C32_11080 [Chloroflexota bacterium]